MKQVWILNHYAQEPSGAGGTRHFHLAENLPAFGWQATVIAASVIAASVELNSGGQRLAPDDHLRHETISGVSFLWIRTPEYEGNGGGRVMNMLAYTFRVLWPGYTQGLPRPDVIMGSSVHPFAALAGAILARRHCVPFVFEVRDLWPQTLVDMGRLRENSLITWTLRRLERWLYQRATRIVVLLPRAVEYIAPLGIAENRVVWIPNGVDLSLFPATALSRQHSVGDPFVLMYFGAHGQANGLDNVLHAMKRVAERTTPGSIHLRMIGDGPLKPGLIKLAEQLGLSNVSFEPPVPKSAIPTLAAQADAFVISVVDLPCFQYGISMNKLFDYLAATRPIVITSRAANNPVAESGAGITVPPVEPDALAQAILEIARTSEEERCRLGAAGRRYVEENHGFDRLAGRLASTLDAAVAEHP